MKAIDLFAGAGGFSAGAKMAGVQVVLAANHWAAAVGIHQLNHSEAIHVCQDLHQARWDEVPAHDLLLASPCCQGHSKARGKTNGNLTAYYGNEQGGRSINRPIGTITTRDRWAVIDGDKMRMISVNEARRAMGFPAGYVLPDQSRLAMHMLGNAVCPPVARDVIEAIWRAA